MSSVLISGASIAGPALAHWLRHHGLTPTVVERAPAPRPGGQAVDVRGTARQVIERMGVLDEVRAAHTGARGMAFVNASGKRTATMASDTMGDSGGAIAEIEILRGDLVRILHDQTADDVEYLFDDTITSLTETPDGVDVTFERSAPRRFDLVVGADGLHSKVRALAFGPESSFVHDMGAYTSIFSTTRREDLDGWMLMHTVPGRTAGIYPTPGGQAKAMFVFKSPEVPHDRRDDAFQRDLIARTFASDGWQVPRLLTDLKTSPDFYFDRLCQIRMDTWSRGRVVLLGDAAFCASPMAGNGTSMALVGAYLLAGELASSRDHTTAFRRYEEAMREYVTQCQEFALGGMAGLLPDSRWFIRMRDFTLRVIPHIPGAAKLFGGDLQKIANTVTLPDYPVRTP
ncbi:2-polyprenyl-6-methoxyphenol hydroxylase-like FAD-dependent oxidoreductase [Saccharothrix tamanrassetensis]|uniref:2-polyprenyl-6-methoxyphenol hydroxylase-like FAD-dependent oxidoreductase n=1 Tax=Saccharothrix tamanrassetensis TaxID=1051531 RepID=A0A841CQN8_9PSEU|nr:FAD-dependent monooxygenase [Saccharothrix tamanrassetensis]MBB5959213.1 2-polyprenyl-6-methoxyphenol hydroxylase-like FAD-dependent oxidoreductase [Saccharothrix tamanrassetensis]